MFGMKQRVWGAAIVQQLHEAEDRANERHYRASRELAEVRELLGEVGSKLDRVLEQGTRAGNERKVLRQHVRSGVPVVDLPKEGEWPTSVDTAFVVGPSLTDNPQPGEKFADLRPVVEERGAKLAPSSPIDPADAVRGAPTLPPRTVQTMPGAQRKADGGIPELVLGSSAAPLPRGVVPVASRLPESSDGTWSVSKAAKELGLAYSTMASYAHLIDGAVKEHGKWRLPIEATKAWAKARA